MSKAIVLNRPATEQQSAPPSESGARILLVDDDERNLLALSEVLSPLAEVVTAASGTQALRHLLEGDFAVILLDVFMPGMDGYEVATLVRSREQTARIPIIFLSAVNKEVEHLRRGYSMGAVDYVFKPVDPLVLASKVAVFVDLYNLRVSVAEKTRQEQALRDAKLHAEIERLKVGRELQEAEARQAALLEALPLALFEASLSDEGRFVRRFVKGDLQRILGLDAQGLERGDFAWEDRIDAEEGGRDVSAVHRVTDQPLSREYRWIAGDGSVRHFGEIVSRIDATRWAGSVIDVTERRALEEKLVQAGKMDAIGKLTGGIAHDFNNLLAAVLGGINLLSRRCEFGERETLVVQQIRHAAEQGAELVRRMMAFARRQSLSPVRIAAGDLCDSVAGLVAHTLGGRIEIDWHCPDLKVDLFVDRAQLELALVNLIINARDAMPDGGRIEVAFEDDTRSGLDGTDVPFVRIVVRDSGTGIASEDLSRITEPFFTTKEIGRGTGLGLSMVAGFVEQSGGTLEIKSAIGAGTTIEMILPAEPLSDCPQPQAAAPSPPQQVKRTVLLVDDDEAVRTMMREQLIDLGCTVEDFCDAQSAIARFAEAGCAADLVVTDFAMPAMNGLELIEALRLQAPDLAAVLMTGYADEQLIERARQHVPVLRKPLEAAEIFKALQN